MPKKTVKTRKTAKKSKVTTKTSKKASTKKAVKRTRKPVAPKLVAPQPVMEPQPVVVPAAPPPVLVPVKTEAEKIWDEIKGLPIQMFGLPNQFVAQHCTFVTVEPSQLYVTIRSTATLPSLEAAIAPAFVVELADKFVIVKRAPQVLAKK